MAIRSRTLASQSSSSASLFSSAPGRFTARRAAFEATYNVAATDDLDAVLRDPAVDAVILLTPPDSHRDLGGRILSSGKHLLIEKPAGLVTDDARYLADRAGASGPLAAPVLQHRFALPFELWQRSPRKERPDGSAAFTA